MEPYHAHTDPQPLNPSEVYEFQISVEPNAYRFRQGNRIRLELVNGDSPITDVLWTHYYQPNKIGQDTIHHSARYPSRLILPVME
jgi:predicted acyl esterase